jgi:hypothetical protein
MKRILVTASLASAIALSACSGGGGGRGVGTTPPPPPPTGGGTTPTPTPASNEDLVAPLVSESFTNDGATGKASYVGNGFAASVARTDLTVRYDSTNASYTITAPDRSQSFGPAHRDAALSTGEADIFLRRNGNTVDSLSISKTGTGPGTELSPTYRYVSGGVWQRTATGSNSIEGTADVFTFGVETPDTALVRTGTGQYAVQLRGVVAYGDSVIGTRGTGDIDVDFATGRLSGLGDLQELRPDGSLVASQRWGLLATLASGQNSFSGQFSIAPPATATEFTGFTAGRFYGPNAEELGAVYGWRHSFLGLTYSGYILGKNASLYPRNTTLATLAVEQALPSYSYMYHYTLRLSDGEIFGGGEPNPHPGNSMNVRYSEADRAIELDYAFELDRTLLTAADRDAAQSNATYDVYVLRSTASNGTPRTTTVRMFKPGSANPELQLTYASFGAWTNQTGDGSRPDYQEIVRSYFAYGLPTAASAVPVTGTASYDARIFGETTLLAPNDISKKSPRLGISGTARFDFNFASATLAGYFNPVGRDASGKTYTFDQTGFTGKIQADKSFNANFANYAGDLQGQFYGPEAQELAGRFALGVRHPGTGFNTRIFGAFVGKQSATPGQ